MITGAGSGIGMATARRFSDEGYRCILLGRRKSHLDKLKANLKNAISIVCDLTKMSSIADAVKLIRSETDALNCLVNNAGVIDRISFSEVTEKSIYEQFETNVFGAMKLTQKLIPLMLKTEYPSIVNVSSTLGLKPIPNTSIYSASKAALINWTETLALEFSSKNLRVNCVCPGIVKTPIHGPKLDKRIEKLMNENHPLGRMGTPAEVADSIYYLHNSKWSTGTVLVVDGGIRLV